MPSTSFMLYVEGRLEGRFATADEARQTFEKHHLGWRIGAFNSRNEPVIEVLPGAYIIKEDKQ